MNVLERPDVGGTRLLDAPESRLITGRDSEGEKLGVWAADLLQRELLDARLQPGDLMGSMGQIRKRYGLGRWAWREAVRILEMRGVASSRTGPRGGLIVTSPTTRRLANRMLLHLSLSGGLTDQIVAFRRAVHLAMLRKLQMEGAAPPLLAADENADAGWAFAREMAQATGNPGFGFLVDLLDALYSECRAPLRPTDLGPLSAAFWAAAGARRPEAEGLLDAYLTASEGLPLGVGVRLPQLEHDNGAVDGPKAGRRLAARLIDDIVGAGQCGPIHLGSEIDIAARHDSNGEIVRQGVRVLEDLGLVEPRAGRTGGLLSREPDSAAAIRLIPHVLRRWDPQPAHCFEVILLLKVEMHRLAAERVRAEGADGPTACAADRLLQVQLSKFEDLVVYERGLSDLSGNSLLASAELGFLLYAPSPPQARRCERLGGASHAYSMRIADAVRRGDANGAALATLDRLAGLSSDIAAGGLAPSGWVEAVTRGDMPAPPPGAPPSTRRRPL